MPEILDQPSTSKSSTIVDYKSKKSRLNDYYTNNELTAKPEIAWRKDVEYITPAIKWYEPQKQTKTELRSPLYFFQKYFTEDLFDTMVQHTNLYAVQQHARFVPTNRNEIKTFVVIHILMGNLNYPRLRCYWENKLKIPMISESMPRNRFSQLRTHLHFVNVL